MIPEALIVFGPLVLVIAGTVFLWAASSLRCRTGAAGRGAPVRWFSVLGWLLLLVGIFAAIAVMASVFFLLAWLVAIVILLTVRYRYRALEQRSLYWVLMIAAEKGIPLESAARAFAQERYNGLRDCAENLADYLEAGLPLALALQRSRYSLPAEVLLAAELGERTGSLGPALRQAIRRNDDYLSACRSAAEKCFYFSGVVLVGVIVCTFLMLKIFPAFQKILKDMGTVVPPATGRLFGVTNFILQTWPLLLPLLAIAALILLGAMLRYMGLSPRLLPELSRLWSCTDTAVVQRWLASAVRDQRPMTEMTRLLAGYFPRRAMRRKLERAAQRMEQGDDWCESLGNAGVIRRQEIAVLRSAERTGNLAWALDEMADSGMRRAACRLRAITNVAFPASILVLGGGVLLIAMAILSPLIEVMGRT